MPLKPDRQAELERAAKKLPFPLTSPLRPDLNIRNYIIEEPPSNKALIPWAAWYLKKEVYKLRSDNTYESTVVDLQKFVNFFYYYYTDGDISRWDRSASADFMSKLEKAKYSRATRRRIHATISAFATYLGECKIYDYQTAPMRKVKAPNPDKITPKTIQIVDRNGATIDEGTPVVERLQLTAARLIENQKRPPQSRPIRDFAIISVLLSSGLRVSELCGLKIEQFEPISDEEGAFLRDVIGKGDKPRNVFMKRSGADALKRYFSEERCNPKSDAIFLTYFGTSMTRNNVWHILKYLGGETEKDLPPGYRVLINPHRFRHYRCYTMLTAGGEEPPTLVDVADELGHSNLNYLKIYGDSSDKTRARKLKNV